MNMATRMSSPKSHTSAALDRPRAGVPRVRAPGNRSPIAWASSRPLLGRSQQPRCSRTQHVVRVASPSHLRSPAIDVDVAPIALYTQENIAAFMTMARLHNLLPSTLLVLVGAWAGLNHSLTILFSLPVWVMAAVSAGVSAASMVVNDYFDYVSGIDRVNSPHKPLPAGSIAPDAAVLFGALLYMGVLIAACTMEPGALRLLIAASAAATMAYTPLLKKWTAVKNVVVAGIIASALIAGGLAAGAGAEGIKRLLAPTVFVFCGVVYREILMDINDVEGDAACGVSTLPVVAGPVMALNIATGVALAGCGLALWALWASAAGKLAAASAMGGWAAAATWGRVLGLAAVALAAAARLVWLDRVVRKGGVGRDAVSYAVDKCRQVIMFSTIMLAAASP